MGAERVVRWGPPALSQVVTDQLWRHGLGSADAVACARELAAAVGPAARASSFVDLGGCRFLDGDIAGALAAWQQAIVSGQTAPAARALFNLGLLHEHLGLFADAVERFEAAEAHGVAPYAEMAILARARSQHRSGDHDRAVATLARHVDRLMEHNPESPMLGETLLGLGDVAEQAGQLDRAEQAYRAAMTSDDDTVRQHASLALVDVLRFIGHDEEAQQIVEEAGLTIADPVVALDRVELLIRLGRFDEAEAVLDELATDALSVADQFRLATTQIDLGRVNDAIDILEALAREGAPETRARAAYRLGEVYLNHDMAEPAAVMFGNVRGIQPGYWADKASLVLGDLAMAEGRQRIAAAHWADAAASRIESVSSTARERLVDAVVASPAGPEALSEPADTDAVEHSEAQLAKPDTAARVDTDAGPVTEAVDMVSVLDEPVDEDILVPGEITPVAGVLMALPEAEEVDVEVPAEPLGGVLAPPAAPVAVPATATLPEPAEPVAPATPTVIPLRRRSTPPAAPESSSATDGSARELSGADDQPLDMPHTSAASQADEAIASTVAEPDEPVVITLGRSGQSAPQALTAVTEPAEPVIDLREAEPVAPNPYAALAPEALDDDPKPSDRNPYAELAPNFAAEPVDLGPIDLEPIDLGIDDRVAADRVVMADSGDDDERGSSTFSNLA